MSIDRQKVIDGAQKFAAKGLFDKAIVEYMRVVKEDPSDVRILLKIGDLQVRKGAKDDAIATYSRVASGYDQQGFFLKAIAVYKQILSIDPNLTELYSKLADLYVKLGLVPDALAHLDALASRYARAGQDEKVAGVYRQMVQVEPANVACHIKLAELLSKLGKNDDAAREFEAGGQLLRDAKRLEDWAKVAERLLFHRPNDVTAAKELAQYYLGRQDAKRALPKLQVSFKANAKDVDTLEMLATAFRELGQLPKTISVWKEIARIHAETGATEKKLEIFRRVLELAPNDAEAKEGLRGASRLARRPSNPPPAEPPPRKPSQPGMPAASARRDEPEVIEEEEVEEVMVVDDDVAPAPPPVAAAPARPVPPPPAPPRRPAPSQPQLPVVEPPVPLASAKPITQPIPLPARRGAEPPQPVAPPPPADPSAEVARIIGEADIFLKYGLKQKAIAHLVRAIELDPQSLDAHARLRDMYTESGDGPSASHHSSALAEIAAPTDPEAALAEVSHALQLDPNNAHAIDLYGRLAGTAAPGEEQYIDDAGAAQDPYAQQGYGEEQFEGPTAHDGAAGMAEQGDGGAGGALGRDIEEGLDEAEFFVTQGLYDEARDTLHGLLNAHPNHPLVIERVEELEAMLQAQAMPADDQSFALAEKLAEEVDQVQQSSGAQFNDGGEMIDVETVFEQFKRGIEKTVSADDAETHYDLGIAYKEMGLIEDAVSEFKISAQNPRKTCLAETMIGLCYLERGDVAAAIEHLKRALQSPRKTEREEMALYFELGSAYEAVGDLSEAMYFFQKVEKRDPSFRGVRARVQRLAAHVNSGTRTQPSQDEVDEVDRAFDELLKG